MIVSIVGQSSSFSGTSEWFCSSELSAWFKNGKEKERETDWHDNVQDHQHAGQYLSMPPVKKSLKHSIRTDITSKMFQKYAGSVAPPPIALCKSISRNLPSYYIQRSSYLIRQKPTLGYGQCRTGTCVSDQLAFGEAFRMVSFARWPCPKQPRVYPIPRGLGYFQAVILVRIQS